MEQRWSERRAVTGRVRVGFSGGATTETGVQNLSLGGVCVAFHEPVAVGARVELSMRFDGSVDAPRACRLAGEVVHETRGQLGIAFLDADPETVHTLRAALGLPEPASVPRAGRAAA